MGQFDAVRQVLEKTISATEQDIADAAAAAAAEAEEQLSLRRGLVAARQELVAANTRLEELQQDNELLRHNIADLEERNLSLLSHLEAATAVPTQQRGPSPAAGVSRRSVREPRGSYLLTHVPRTSAADQHPGRPGTSHGRTSTSSLVGEDSSMADALDGMVPLYRKSGRRKTFSSFSMRDGDKWNSSPVSPRPTSRPTSPNVGDDAAVKITESMDVFRRQFYQLENTDANLGMQT